MALLSRIQRSCNRDAADIAALLGELEAAVLDAGCPPGRAAALLVVAEEMVTNVARHAWPGGVKPGVFTVTAGISRQAGGVEVLLCTEDDGIPFDPTLREAPDTEAPIELRDIGGLGIHLILQMTDWHWYRREGGHNRFSVMWRCAGAKG